MNSTTKAEAQPRDRGALAEGRYEIDNTDALHSCTQHQGRLTLGVDRSRKPSSRKLESLVGHEGHIVKKHRANSATKSQKDRRCSCAHIGMRVISLAEGASSELGNCRRTHPTI